VSNYSDNLWAEEMGIDLDALKRESPLHPDQMRANRRLTKQAAEYWSKERFLTQLKDTGFAPAPEPSPPRRVKTPSKPARVKRYEFTDAQLGIAERSLNAGGAV
jgi:hypothetical protein